MIHLITPRFSSIEVKGVEGADLEELQESLETVLGKDFKVLNRDQQQVSIYLNYSLHCPLPSNGRLITDSRNG